MNSVWNRPILSERVPKPKRPAALATAKMLTIMAPVAASHARLRLADEGCGTEHEHARACGEREYDDHDPEERGLHHLGRSVAPAVLGLLVNGRIPTLGLVVCRRQNVAKPREDEEHDDAERAHDHERGHGTDCLHDHVSDRGSPQRPQGHRGERDAVDEALLVREPARGQGQRRVVDNAIGKADDDAEGDEQHDGIRGKARENPADAKDDTTDEHDLVSRELALEPAANGATRKTNDNDGERVGECHDLRRPAKLGHHGFLKNAVAIQ